MSEEEKANVDIAGLSSHLRNSLIAMGVLIILSPYLFRLLGFPSLAHSSMSISLLLPLPYVLIKAQQYDNNKLNFKKIIPFIALAVVFAIIFGIFFYRNKESTFKIDSNQLTITGSYGDTYRLKNLDLIESIPQIRFKSNGYSLGETRKGNFKLEEWDNCLLFTESNDGPYILAMPVAGKRIIINRESPEKTRELFNELKADQE